MTYNVLAKSGNLNQPISISLDDDFELEILTNYHIAEGINGLAHKSIAFIADPQSQEYPELRKGYMLAVKISKIQPGKRRTTCQCYLLANQVALNEFRQNHKSGRISWLAMKVPEMRENYPPQIIEGVFLFEL